MHRFTAYCLLTALVASSTGCRLLGPRCCCCEAAGCPEEQYSAHPWSGPDGSPANWQGPTHYPTLAHRFLPVPTRPVFQRTNGPGEFDYHRFAPEMNATPLPRGEPEEIAP